MNKSAYSKRGIVALCAIVYFTSYFSRKSFAASLFGMMEAGAILQGTAGLVETAMFICYGLRMADPHDTIVVCHPSEGIVGRVFSWLYTRFL
jgi:hypothetical protein